MSSFDSESETKSESESDFELENDDPMCSTSYSTWQSAWNKDALEFYDDDIFRKHYTMMEMHKKATLFENHSQADVTSALGKISQRDNICILSLGCGPGSDLLGILGAVDSALRSGVRSRKLQCYCTGVDAFKWTRDTFRRRIRRADFCSLMGKVDYSFIRQDMDTFVASCLEDYSPFKNDFICLSFADAGRNLELIGTALPQLLTEFGRILVLDNDIPTVRSLTDYGFTCTFTGYNYCMHTRGWENAVFRRAEYQPSGSSPFRVYTRQKRKAEVRARLKEETRRQALIARSAEAAAGHSFSAYPYDRKKVSWCERLCSIL